MNKALHIAILRTIAYADVFDCPMTVDELWRFLITDAPISKELFRKELKKASKLVVYRNGFYCLKNRTHIIDKRIKKETYVNQKMKIAHKISSYLFYVPTVLLIGVSGGLAIHNADKNDDIDLFVITKSGTLWISRLILVILLEILGVRRKRGEKNVENTICLNMLIDQRVLGLPKKRQNLYTAHEVMQMKPIFDRDNMYQKFIGANMWVKDYLPNSLDTRILGYKDIKKKISPNILVSQYLNIFEYLAKILQLWSIKKHQTTEVITDSVLAFHPFDYEQKTLNAYKERLKQYKI